MPVDQTKFQHRRLEQNVGNLLPIFFFKNVASLRCFVGERACAAGPPVEDMCLNTSLIWFFLLDADWSNMFFFVAKNSIEQMRRCLTQVISTFFGCWAPYTWLVVCVFIAVRVQGDYGMLQQTRWLDGRGEREEKTLLSRCKNSNMKSWLPSLREMIFQSLSIYRQITYVQYFLVFQNNFGNICMYFPTTICWEQGLRKKDTTAPFLYLRMANQFLA